ncbi:MAG: GntR family transcriptional regulator [Verrucomicrobiota bacterium]
MIPFSIQFKGGAPLSEQIIAGIKKAIAIGQLKAGEKFPSVRQLSLELKINPNTAHKVVQALVQEGILVVTPAIGSVIANIEPSSAKKRQELLQEPVENLVIEAKRLQLPLEVIEEILRKTWNQMEKKE